MKKYNETASNSIKYHETGISSAYQEGSEMAELLRLIPVGRENAQSRYDLRSKLSISDRKLRDLISQARADGAFICSIDRGYFIADKDEDILSYYLSEHRRAISILNGCKHMRRYLKDKGIEI